VLENIVPISDNKQDLSLSYSATNVGEKNVDILEKTLRTGTPLKISHRAHTAPPDFSRAAEAFYLINAPIAGIVSYARHVVIWLIQKGGKYSHYHIGCIFCGMCGGKCAMPSTNTDYELIKKSIFS